jgi:MFS family permease
VRRSGHVASILSRSGLRRLIGVRLIGEFGDGIFQASLAGAVLFNPERQGSSAALAAAFATLLVPYSLIGPFAGVLLDRWWRQRVLVLANVLRAGIVVAVAAEIWAGWDGPAFYITALVVISLARFILSGLSASLPHVVPDTELVTANAVTGTAGAVFAVAGGAAAVGGRALVGSDNHAYALIALSSGLAYLLAAAVAGTFERPELGPDEVQRQHRETLADVARGLVAGARHVHAVGDVARGLAVGGIQRFGFGMTLVATVLLNRNYFDDDGIYRAGVTGLTQAVVAAAIGNGLAAFITPTAFRRIGVNGWIGALMVFGAAVQVLFVLPYRQPLLLLGSFLLGIVTQGVKISVDTLVQSRIDDRYRGRVFSIYDAIINLSLVAAAVLTALALPETGRAPHAVLATAALFLVAGATYGRFRTATSTSA